jgi:hypothetical protein
LENYYVLIIPPVAPLGRRDQYFWVLQKWLFAFGDAKSTIIMPRNYMDRFSDSGRWELSDDYCQYHQFHPTAKICAQTEIEYYAERHLIADPSIPPSVIFDDFVKRVNPALVDDYVALVDRIRRRRGDVPVVLVSWVTNPSLRVAAERGGCRTVFNEFGPLRKPYYRHTAYWDFRGVNGDTGAEALWQSEKAAFSAWLTERAPVDMGEWLRDLVVTPAARTLVRVGGERYKVGLALQIETDSNVIAFGNGWTNLTLVDLARAEPDSAPLLIRHHPGGKAVYVGPADQNKSPLDFLSAVSSVWTINSSLGIEAELWGKNARILGDSPFLPFYTVSLAERPIFLSWFFLRYLMPFDFVFSSEYYNWRLSGQSPGQIAERHIAHYQSDSAALWRTPPIPRSDTWMAPVSCRPPAEMVGELEGVHRLRGIVASLRLALSASEARGRTANQLLRAAQADLAACSRTNTELRSALSAAVAKATDYLGEIAELKATLAALSADAPPPPTRQKTEE